MSVRSPRGGGLLLAAILLGLAPAPASQSGERAAVFITLGTGGGPRVQANRSQPANALVIGGAIYLFDVGDGVQRQLAAAGLPLNGVKAIFLSHHHIDHLGGLAPLLVNRWVERDFEPIPVVGPPGTADMVRNIFTAFRPIESAPLASGATSLPPLSATATGRDMAAAMDQPTLIYQDELVRIFAITNTHYHPRIGDAGISARSYAYRIEAGGRSIVFTGDTGPSRNVEMLARDADILVSEVMDREAVEAALRRITTLSEADIAGFLIHMDQDHLTPGQIGLLAAKARVKAVVLTHLVPGLDGEKDVDGYIRGIANSYHGPVTVARDLDKF